MASVEHDRLTGALTVPVQAIFESEGKRFCYYYEGKEFRMQEVVIGKQNEDWVEITSGLNEADRIALAKPGVGFVN